jgi:hypothetical protein
MFLFFIFFNGRPDLLTVDFSAKIQSFYLKRIFSFPSCGRGKNKRWKMEEGLMAVIIVAARRPCPLSLSLSFYTYTHTQTHTHTQNLFSISSTLVYTLSIGF